MPHLILAPPTCTIRISAEGFIPGRAFAAARFNGKGYTLPHAPHHLPPAQQLHILSQPQTRLCSQPEESLAGGGSAKPAPGVPIVAAHVIRAA